MSDLEGSTFEELKHQLEECFDKLHDSRDAEIVALRAQRDELYSALEKAHTRMAQWAQLWAGEPNPQYLREMAEIESALAKARGEDGKRPAGSAKELEGE